jgi:septal ring factor EnvC (AmiA/AmiB activator)
VTIVERAKKYEKEVTLLERKLERRIRTIEAYIVSKQNSVKVIRNETTKIIQRLNELNSSISLLKQALKSTVFNTNVKI